MGLIISEHLAKELADFFSSLSEHDLEMLQVSTNNLTKRLKGMAKRQPNGCSMGRWDDRNGITPNEVEADDSNP